jgi:hypothetical protein
MMGVISRFANIEINMVALKGVLLKGSSLYIFLIVTPEYHFSQLDNTPFIEADQRTLFSTVK